VGEYFHYLAPYLKAKIDELKTNSKIKNILDSSVGASLILRRVTSLELIW
jgi:hypothetical protein